MVLTKENQILFQKTQDKILSMDWLNPDFYKEWLAQTYFFVSHSTRIIAGAGIKFSLERNELHNRFLEHAKEEKNHEIVAVTDLKHLDANIANFKPLPVTQAFYQTQYYWINEVDPISVYGYFILLETLATDCGPKVIEILQKKYPAKAMNFLKVHVEEDIDHMETHENILAKLSKKDIDLINQNFAVSNCLYVGMIDAISEKISETKNRKNWAA